MRTSQPLSCLLACGLLACGGLEAENDEAGLRGGASFDVDFAGCNEIAGIGFVPAANARPLVPSGYTLAGDAESAVIVVRVAQCEALNVDGHARPGGTVAQIGLTLVGPDLSADINNYALWYHTDSAQLAGRLRGMGVDARFVHDLVYDLAGAGLTIESEHPQDPAIRVSGSVVPPAAAPVPFVASWWQDGPGGSVRMRTVLPEIQFSSAVMTLEADPGSELAQLIGGTSLSFALLDSFNTFAAAHMEVRLSE